MSAPPAHAVRCLKSHGPQSVWLIHPPGAELRVRKVWPMRGWTLGKVILHIAQPQRQIRGAQRLRQAGLATPDVLQPLRFDFARREIAIELAYAEGDSALDVLKQGALDEGRQRSCAAAIGSLIPRLARARLFNRDFKLSNLIVSEQNGEWIIWIIDPVGVRWQRDRIEEITRMLHRLASEPVVMSIGLPRRAVLAALLNALRPLQASEREEVLRRLRQHRPH